MSKERRSRGGRGGDIRRSTCWRREDVRKTDGVKVRGGRARSGPVTPKEERERETGSNRFSFYSAEFTGASAADRKRRTVKHEAAESWRETLHENKTADLFINVADLNLWRVAQVKGVQVGLLKRNIGLKKDLYDPQPPDTLNKCVFSRFQPLCSSLCCESVSLWWFKVTLPPHDPSWADSERRRNPSTEAWAQSTGRLRGTEVIQGDVLSESVTPASGSLNQSDRCISGLSSSKV